MKFFLSLLPLLSLAVAGPVERATQPDLSAQVNGNLTKSGTDIVSLNKTLNSFANDASSINLFTLGALQVQAQTISYDIGNATRASNNSAPFTQAESKTISDTVIRLEPSIKSLLQNFINHVTAFKNQKVVNTVLTALQQQRELVRELGNSLTTKAAQPYKAGAPGNATLILGYFDNAIKVFKAAA